MNEIQKRYELQIREMVDVCNRLALDKYVTSHGGNISWAVDRSVSGKTESNILITPTKKFKGEISFDDICITDYGGKVLYAPPGGKPTGELPFHILIFHERNDISSIIHAHPPYTTAFSISNGINYLSLPILPETTTEIGPVCMVPYAEPLTEKLANNFSQYLDRYNAFLMENHGITVVCNDCIERTRQLVDIIECTAISIVEALRLGNVNTIPFDEVLNLEETMKTRNLPLPGKPGVWKSLTDAYGLSHS